MQLTAQTLGDLIKSLRSNPCNGADKRRNPRVGLRARAEIQIPVTNERLSIWVRDVSAGGVNILCPRYFEVNAQFTLVLGDDSSEQAICTVRHCRKVGSDLYGIGAKFVDYSPRKRAKAA
jgi:hypothetical protein